MYSPIFSSLKNFYPDAQVDVVFNKLGYELYSLEENIDNIFIFNRKKDSFIKQLQLVLKFRKEKYNFSLHLRSGVRNEMLAYFGGVKKRFGRKLKGSWQFLNNYVEKIPRQHAKDEYKEFLKVAFDKTVNFNPSLPENELAKQEVQSFLIDKKINKNFLVVHPFGDTISEENWQKDIFKKIINQVQMPIFILGRKTEILNFLFSNNPNVTTLSDQHIGFVSELIKRADFFVGNDSGLFHIAECHKVRSFVFYQKNKDNFVKWSPIEKRSKSYFVQDFQEKDLVEVIGEINEKA